MITTGKYQDEFKRFCDRPSNQSIEEWAEMAEATIDSYAELASALLAAMNVTPNNPADSTDSIKCH